MSSGEERHGAVTVLAAAPTLMVSVERGERGRVEDVHLHPGGQGFWVARMASRLGARVTLVTALGGEPGVALRALMESERIAIEAVDAVRPSAVWISEEAEGERATMADMDAPVLARHVADSLVNALLAAGLESEVTVLTGAPPEVLPAEQYRRLAHDLRAVGGKVLADLSGDQLRAALAGGADVVKVAHDDLVESGLAAGDSPEHLLAGAAAAREAGAGAVLVSRAAEPLLADLGEGRLVKVGTPAFRPLNHRGAGDSMTGAMAAAIAAGEPLEAGVRLAVAAGALNVTRHGLGSGDARAIRRLAERVELTDALPP